MKSKSLNKILMSVISLFVIILCFGFVLTGCGGDDTNKDNDTVTTTTINLNEAKEIIINALSIEQAQVMTFAGNEGNRDIFEKLGKFSVNSKIYQEEQLIQTENTVAEYANNSFLQLYSQQTQTEYMTENTIESELYITLQQVYQLTNGVVSASQLPEQMMQSFTLFNNALAEECFQSGYDEDVIKQTGQDGFSLTLNMNLFGYTYYTMGSILDETNFNSYWQAFQLAYEQMPQEYKDYYDFKIVFDFDNNNQITSFNMDIKYVGVYANPSGSVQYYKVRGEMLTSKYSGEISQPQWVTDYISGQE